MCHFVLVEMTRNADLKSGETVQETDEDKKEDKISGQQRSSDELFHVNRVSELVDEL